MSKTTTAKLSPAITADEAYWLRLSLQTDVYHQIELLGRTLDEHDRYGQMTAEQLETFRKTRADLERAERRLDAAGWNDDGFDGEAWDALGIELDDLLALGERRLGSLLETAHESAEGDVPHVIRGLAVLQGLVERLRDEREEVQ